MPNKSEFIPSVAEQKQLMRELVFIFATSIIEHNPQLQRVYSSIYPKHLDYPYSHFSGLKTFQVIFTHLLYTIVNKRDC